ncbi:TonB-dependent receptor domain-containing protein [Chitinophaga sp. 22620]|uniref:TonB-dependent receptor n=1 Tax=Chitinophaga sp. 22620 TaxID=3453952 RepID=UPI003F8372D4
MTKLTFAGQPVFLMIVFCILLNLQGRAQSTRKISLDVKNAPLTAVLEAIEKQTGSPFIYNRQQVEKIQVASASYQQKSLTDVLDHLLGPYKFGYKLEGGNIILFPQPKKEEKKNASDPGQVSGRIIDEENGQAVPGATVQIGAKGTITAIDGSFTLMLPAGRYTAIISYIGYGTKEISEIEVTGQKTFELNATLKRRKGQLGTVVVTASARKESVAALYARQKNAAAVSDGISAEQIRATPDNNAAQVLKRISGLTVQEEKFVTVRGLSERYNNVILNGANLPSTEPNRRNFSFDVIPSVLIDNIVVNKTATPDMPAEFAGGLVQVNTKDIPAENFASISVGTGINTNSTGKSLYSSPRGGREYLGFDDGRRTWWKKDWDPREYRHYAAVEDNMKASEMNARIPNNWGLYKYKYTPVQNYQFSAGRRISLKNASSLGITLAGTYRHEENITDDQRRQPGYYDYNTGNSYNFSTALGAVANAGFQAKGHKLAFKNLYNHRFSHESGVNYGKEFNFQMIGTPGGDEVFYYTDILLINELLQNRLEGEHLLHKHLKFDWSADYITINRYQPDSRSSMGYQGNGPKGYYEYLLNEGSSYMTRGNNIFNSELKERRQNVSGNFSVPFKIGEANQLIKLGYAGAFRKAHFQSTSLRLFQDSKGDPNATAKAILGLADYELQNFLKPGYLTYVLTGTGSGYAGEDYAGDQQLHAAYLMADLNFLKKFRFIGGMRVEKNNMDVNAIAYNANSGLPVDSNMRYRRTDWLPSANLVYSLTSTMNIRLAYSETLARADFRERSAFKYYEFRDRSIYRGSIGLDDAKIRNLDIRYEYYPGPGEVISVSGFYKKFRKPVELIGLFSGSAELNLFYFNLESATNKGVEIDIRKSLGFIAPAMPWLKKIFVSANGSWMKGDVAYNAEALSKSAADAGSTPGQDPPASRRRPLQGLSPYVINAGLGYFGNVFGANITYNRYGRRILNGGYQPWQDQYENSRDVIDIQLSAVLLKNRLQVRFNISDLLQQDYVIYQNVSANPSSVNGGGAFILGSAEDMTNKANMNDDPKGLSYNKELDFALHKWFKGRNLSLTATYNF